MAAFIPLAWNARCLKREKCSAYPIALKRVHQMPNFPAARKSANDRCRRNLTSPQRHRSGVGWSGVAGPEELDAVAAAADIVVVQGAKAACQNLLSIQAEVFGRSLADYRHDLADC